MKPIDYLMLPLIVGAMIYHVIAISNNFPEDPLQDEYDQVMKLLCDRYSDLDPQANVWQTFPELWTAQQMITQSNELEHQVKNLFKDISNRQVRECLQKKKACQLPVTQLGSDSQGSKPI